MIAIRHNFARTLSAAGIVLFALAGHAPAQVWSNPAGGNWSVGTNWVGGVPPTPGATTALTFSDVAAQAATFTATNDIADPFALNSLTVNHTAGTVTLAGGVLNFDGATPAINMTGAGNATISQAATLTVSTAVAGAGAGTLTFGGAVTGGANNLTKTSAGPLVLAAGGSLNTLSVQAGTATATGGTLALTSPTGTGNVSSGLQIGAAAGQTASFTATGATTVINVTENIYIADATGTTGTITVTNGATMNNLGTAATGRFGVGNSSTGTLNVTAGGIVNTNQLFAARLAGATSGTVLVDGTGSLLHAVTQLSFGTAGLGQMTVQNGGRAVSDGSINIGRAIGAGINGIVTVTGTGSSMAAGTSMTVGTAGNGSLTVQNGGTVTVTTNTFTAIQANTTGTITVTGAGSTLTNTGQFSLSGGGGTGVNAGAATLNVQAGGAVSVGGLTLFGQNGGGSSTVNIDAGTYTATGQTQMNNATVTVTVQNGGTYTANGSVFVGTNAGATATVSVTGSGSALTSTGTSGILLGGTGTTPGGTGVLNVGAGGAISAAGLLTLFGGGTANVNAGGTLNAGGLADGVAGTSVGAVATQPTGVVNINGTVSGAFSGVISGGGAVNKSNTGTQTFSGANTYTGNTTVSGGNLTLTGSGSIANSPIITVGTAPASTAVLDVTGVTGGLNFNATSNSFALAAGQTLGGGGTVNGSTAIPAGTTLAPGNSIGTTTLSNGSMFWQPNGTLAYEYNVAAPSPAPTTDADFINGVTNGLLNLVGLGTAAGQQFNLQLIPVPNAPGSATPVQYTIGTFTGVTLPAGVTGPDITSLFAISGVFGSPPQVTTDGTGVFVTFAPVPEPSTLVLLSGVAVGGVGWRRIRGRAARRAVANA
jgi:T5SS/PEP-CTERM-associated repeat protein